MEMSRTSLVASAAMHVVLIGFGLVSLSSPRAMDATASDSISVEFVPVEDKATSVAGDAKAPLGEKPAPLPTERPDSVADAQNIGDNTVDSKAPPVPEARPKQVEIADAAKKQPKPTDNPKPEEVEAKEKPTPVPATEVAPIPTPRQEVTPDPVKTADVRPTPKPEPQEDEIKKAIAEEEAKAAKDAAAAKAAAEKAERQAAETKAAELAEKKAAEEKATADAAAKAKAEKEAAAAKAAKEKEVAEAKAKAQKEAADKKAAEAAAAKAKERKDAEKAAKVAANKPKSSDDGSLEDDISKLLNKDKSGGGAKSSTQQAALGTKKTTGGKLSQNEEGALREQLAGCWSLPAGMDSGSGLRATIRIRVNPDKTVDGRPTIEKSSGDTVFDESARRAVMKCNSQGLKLPDGKEDIWADVVINFDPQDMLF